MLDPIYSGFCDNQTDKKDCHHVLITNCGTYTSARTYLLNNGWSILDGQFFCPDCTKENNERKLV
jgi:hypothetical protein